MQPEIRVEASAWIFLCILILTVPLKWVLAAITAAAIHELCHCGMLMLLEVPIQKIRIGARGAVMETAPMSPKQELLSSVSGPAGSLILLLFIQHVPTVALCGLVQGAYNMLPIYPLDGGRIFRSAFTLLKGKIPCKRKKVGVQ